MAQDGEMGGFGRDGQSSVAKQDFLDEMTELNCFFGQRRHDARAEIGERTEYSSRAMVEVK